LSLIGATLRSKTRMVVALVLFLGAMAGHLAWAIPWIENSSTSIGTNLILIVIAMLLGLGAGFVSATLLGDMLFRRTWRAEIFAHQPFDSDMEAADLAVLSKSMKARTLQFSLLVVVCTAGILFTAETLSGNFFERYHAVGYFKTVFRSNNTDLKTSTVRRIGSDYGPPLVKQVPLVLALLEQPTTTGELRHASATALAQVSRLVRVVTRPPEDLKDKPSRWRFNLARILASEEDPSSAYSQAVGWIQTDTAPHMRSVAWILVANLKPDKLRLLIEQSGSLEQVKDDERRVMVIALQRLATFDDVPFLVGELSADRSESVQITAMWTLGTILKHYRPKGPTLDDLHPNVKTVLDRLETYIQSESIPLVCIALETHLILGSASMTKELFAQFAARDASDACPSLSYHTPDGKRIDFIKMRRIQLRLLDAIAVIAAENPEALENLQQLSAEKSKYPDDIQMLIRQMLKDTERFDSTK